MEKNILLGWVAHSSMDSSRPTIPQGRQQLLPRGYNRYAVASGCRFPTHPVSLQPYTYMIPSSPSLIVLNSYGAEKSHPPASSTS